MKKLLLPLSLTILLGFYACKSDTGTTTTVKKEEVKKEEKAAASETGCSKERLTYEVNIKPTLTTYCTGCHSGDNPPDGINLTKEDVVKALALRGKLMCVLSSPDCKAMPPGKRLPKDQVDMIECWIKNNAP
mgnify:CR=1 FL=1